MRFALIEADRARADWDDQAATRAWKVVLVAPRTLVAQTSAAWPDSQESVGWTVC